MSSPPSARPMDAPRTARSASDREHSPSHPRVSPTLVRSYDPHDPEARERQRTMDVDSAIQLSRARSASIVRTPPSPPHDGLFPMLSLQEEEVHSVRGAVPPDYSRDPAPFSLPLPVQMEPPSPPHLISASPVQGDMSQPGFLPEQHAFVRSNFDFALLETFASNERTRLGLDGPAPTATSDLRRRLARFSWSGLNESTGPPASVLVQPTDNDHTVVDNLPHRQRLMSNSNTPRRLPPGKLALFEGTLGAPPPTLSPPSFPVRREGVEDPYAAETSLSGGGARPIGADRPFRFSFYSNVLGATIHSRSLAELPAAGQSFEDLFCGSGGTSTRPGTATPMAPGVLVDEDDARTTRAGHSSGGATPAEAGNVTDRKAPQPLTANSTLASIMSTSSASRSAHSNGKQQPDAFGRGGPSDAEGTWWLDVLCPTEEEMRMLSKAFSIHPLTTEDILMEETREKIELFRNYYLVCFRSFDQDPYSPTHLEPLNMYIIVFREGTLSFHFHSTSHPQNVRRRIKQLKDYINVTSDWISYALIDDITDAFGPLIQSIEYEVDSIDELVLILNQAERTDMLRRIGTCRKKVMGLLRLMGNKADVVKGLAKRCNEQWSVAPKSDIGLYLSDIQDHLITMTQNLNHYEKILSRSHSNYLAQISIEMTDANNQINDVLSKLTALGTVLIPMNLITGLWGMNVHVPGQDVDGFKWFLSIIAVLIGIAIVGSYLTYKLMRNGR